MDLQTAVEVIQAPLGEMLPRLSEAIAETIPHRAVAELSNCSFAPFKFRGESPGPSATIADLDALRPLVPVRGTWQGRAVMAGAEVPVVVLSSAVSEPNALLVLLRAEDTPVPEELLAPARALFDVVTAHMEGLRNEAVPATLAVSRAAAAARAMTISDLGDAYGTVLTALLDVLRDRTVDAAAARTRAVDLAVTALVDLRSRAELERALTEERADDAFQRLAESLRRVLRGRGVQLDLGTPGAEEGADRVLPTEVASTAGAVVRSAVHAMLDDQRGVRRVHIAWKVVATVLRATVRDDGPGTLSCGSLDTRRVPERLGPLGGKVEVDAVPGWGTTVTIEVPLGPPENPREDPLTVLGTRELEVLGHLARGRRNRDIAGDLHISESTVKFHVAKILEKLAVGSRGEAAALAHEWGAAR
ncbi:LuxR C-terminal-related transcriptional regulator [Lentzea sp. BCCO 10_0856]|uniref:LuxR C-terminal-related transcriptional regulator n=1 Tax=Lentzea miocenica TaxID=3095431 RepID=A0ABU4SRW9_9PSEU|nr:LuxR C-terminal-related transcriptional regulator [Lentzea sp. BCCO 10_0856]MDX8028640.1 LuxR C-terminal-related transcriptional regulator [Lentzea sp. BCCO 10_0856]